MLDSAGQPIRGLYAVGEVARFGGGGYRALEGTLLGDCLFSGRTPVYRRGRECLGDASATPL